MRMLLAQKFGLGEPLARRLLATGNAQLIEGNHWGDRHWGVSAGIGHNRLGQLLMQRRGATARDTRCATERAVERVGRRPAGQPAARIARNRRNRSAAGSAP
jgi:hypothetical protein